jgi:hypothetical protein
MPVWPEQIASALERHEVVAVTSGLTDLREAEELLEQRLPGRWLRIEWGMGSAANRARFHEVQEISDFQMLPMFITREGVIGGLPELRRYLAGRSAAGAQHAPVSAGATDVQMPLLRALGYGGLVPFAFFGMAAWFGTTEWHAFSLQALAVYGAVILSFLGAIHWGLALADRSHRVLGLAGPVWSVMPSIAAWLGLLLPRTAGLIVLLLLFPLVLWVDRASLRAVPLPPGYLTLRGYLTLGAVLFLLSGSLASLTIQ